MDCVMILNKLVRIILLPGTNTKVERKLRLFVFHNGLITFNSHSGFSQTHSCQGWNYCQHCVLIYLHFSSLFTSNNVSKCEIRKQRIYEDYILRINASWFLTTELKQSWWCCILVLWRDCEKDSIELFKVEGKKLLYCKTYTILQLYSDW